MFSLPFIKVCKEIVYKIKSKVNNFRQNVFNINVGNFKVGNVGGKT